MIQAIQVLRFHLLELEKVYIFLYVYFFSWALLADPKEHVADHSLFC